MRANFNFIFLTILLIALTFIFGCESDQASTEQLPLDTNATNKAIVNNKIDKAEKIKKIFYALPSPLELSLMFKREGVQYQREKLHSTDAIVKYNSLKKKALNLGVYGADLSYAGLFSNNQDVINYFVTAKKLADDIGISQVFELDFISRLENNAENKDTLLQVITDFFLENDIYLKTQGQQDISIYVLIGGWVEGMYLGSEMAKEEHDGFRNIIARQKSSMQNLISLLNSVDNKVQEDSLKSKMEVLAAIYDKVDIEYPIDKDQLNQEKISFLNNEKKVHIKMSDPVFRSIQREVKAIREYIIK